MSIYEVVVTGGACAGKTSGMNQMVESFRSLGWRVLVVPEQATRLILGGIEDLGEIARSDFEHFVAIEEQMLLMAVSERRSYQALARTFDGNTLILYDRGISDIAAFVGSEQFALMLDRNGLTMHDVRDSYDAVIHLVTAADGAEEFYTSENNAARWETAEEARQSDSQLRQAWHGARLQIIDNSSSFDDKMQRAVAAVFEMLEI